MTRGDLSAGFPQGSVLALIFSRIIINHAGTGTRIYSEVCSRRGAGRRNPNSKTSWKNWESNRKNTTNPQMQCPGWGTKILEVPRSHQQHRPAGLCSSRGKGWGQPGITKNPTTPRARGVNSLPGGQILRSFCKGCWREERIQGCGCPQDATATAAYRDHSTHQD